MSEKKGLLPIVDEDIGRIVKAEIPEGKERQYLAEIIERLSARDNPHLGDFISRYSINMQSQDLLLTATYSAVVVYRLLESQAEADSRNGKETALPMVKEGMVPRVQADVKKADVKKGGIKEYLSEMIQRLATEDNPLIANFMVKYAKGMPTQKLQGTVAPIGLMVYRILESQAEADKLKKEFRIL